MKYRKIASLSELEDGWYWWRSDGSNNDRIVLEVDEGGICYVGNDPEIIACYLEGEFAGPIPTPEELANIILVRDTHEEAREKYAGIIVELHVEINKLKSKQTISGAGMKPSDTRDT